MSRDLRPAPSSGTGARQPASFLDELYPGAGEELDLTPRSSRPRHSTSTSDAFGGVDVGAPVSRLPGAVAPVVQEPVPAPAAEARPQRCPSCGARVRAEQDWCSLCHASVLPAPAPAPSPAAAVPVPEPGPAVVRPAPEPDAVRVSEDSDGQLALDFGTGADNAPQTPAEPPTEPPTEPPVGPAVDEAEVSRMLGLLARTSGGAPRGLGTRQARIAVAVGGGLGLTALLLGGMTALGSVLG